ncbi:hypothetical protein ACFQJD_04485 [Haloplanus sp. GCM10025708]|uniref:hypothetical protein n=1 Tax=Haloferacaceae TaxID=1644056 RepID=UPI00361C62D4
MANPATVKDALASLAADDPGATPAYRRPIDEASSAADDVTATAAFAADGGVVRLRRAIRAAARRDDEAAATAGREALARIERYRRAAVETADSTTTTERTAPGPRDGSAADHFRSARGTVLGRDRQRPDE